MGILAGTVGIVAFLVVLDQVAVWAEQRGWIHWRHRGGGGGAGLFNAAQELITPSIRHMVEERHRLRTTRLTHSADGSPFMLDLERGVIAVNSGTNSPPGRDTPVPGSGPPTRLRTPDE
ncbi:hypothetical protein [Nocardia sp. CC227C]|uniref:hypothetical protein n=1 Tax=Nocardia sp. CC227C TaxID=3044562 RepID=UPI00278C9039|nr:hypothetical protein [Nocardia sp. CC227C]